MVLLLSTIPSKTQDPSKIFKDSLSSQSAETTQNSVLFTDGGYAAKKTQIIMTPTFEINDPNA